MVTTKQKVARVLAQLPDDCSIEDVQYELYVIETIQTRLKLAGQGIAIPQIEAERRLREWLTK